MAFPPIADRTRNLNEAVRINIPVRRDGWGDRVDGLERFENGVILIGQQRRGQECQRGQQSEQVIQVICKARLHYILLQTDSNAFLGEFRRESDSANCSSGSGAISK